SVVVGKGGVVPARLRVANQIEPLHFLPGECREPAREGRHEAEAERALPLSGPTGELDSAALHGTGGVRSVASGNRRGGPPCPQRAGCRAVGDHERASPSRAGSPFPGRDIRRRGAGPSGPIPNSSTPTKLRRTDTSRPQSSQQLFSDEVRAGFRSLRWTG